MTKTKWINLEPKLEAGSLQVLNEYVKQINAVDMSALKRNEGLSVDALCQRFLSSSNLKRVNNRTPLKAIIYIISDLIQQGWRIRMEGEQLSIMQPTSATDIKLEKDRIRAQLHVERDRQLISKAVCSFIISMEHRRLHNGKWSSIFSLMRDGRELSDKLKKIKNSYSGDERNIALAKVVDPYFQIVDQEKICEFTGLRLMDIWRYFRHTWSIPYRSIPGRKLMIIIRDKAIEPHPVIGIAALSSPAVQIKIRDEWIGWHSETFIKKLQNEPKTAIARKLQTILDEAINYYYISDFIEENIITVGKIKNPNEKICKRLKEYSIIQRESHNKLSNKEQHKQKIDADKLNDDYWENQARSHLFKSKRAEQLSSLLWSRMIIKNSFGDSPTGKKLSKLIESVDGKKAISHIIKAIKSEKVGTVLADISICGAIPPYNDILGGKLVSMLLASPEIVEAYQKRYGESPSIIASSLAGKAVIRSTDLVLLGTTSLYGIGSSQYNRIKIPCNEVGGAEGEAILYENLGYTEGFGTIQYGNDTLNLLVKLQEQSSKGQNVRSIFGEGVSPRFRKIRGGLEMLGLPSDVLLNHGNKRVVYGISLARNFRQYLLSFDKKPKYFLSKGKPKLKTSKISKWWIKRWLSSRIENKTVLKNLEQHTLSYPITHGARVPLPEKYRSGHQLDLFDNF